MPWKTAKPNHNKLKYQRYNKKIWRLDKFPKKTMPQELKSPRTQDQI